MERLKRILVDDEPLCMLSPNFCWEREATPPALEGWVFHHFCESFIDAGESIEDAMARQQYRCVAQHFDGRYKWALSESQDKAYRTVVDMILRGEGDEDVR